MAIARRLGLSKSAVCYHRRRLGYEIDPKFNRRYDWAEVQRFYDQGHTISQRELQFGFARTTFMEAVARGALVSRPPAAPLSTYLVRGRRENRHHLKGRLIAEGLKTGRCETCAITEWRVEPLSMALHQINGGDLDNRLENLMLLCPNCHAQTPNFSGRALRVRRLAAAEAA